LLRRALGGAADPGHLTARLGSPSLARDLDPHEATLPQLLKKRCLLWTNALAFTPGFLRNWRKKDAEVSILWIHLPKSLIPLALQTAITPLEEQPITPGNNLLYSPSARHQIDDEHNQGNDQQQVNQAPHMKDCKAK
jgi:hypothetical protein